MRLSNRFQSQWGGTVIEETATRCEDRETASVRASVGTGPAGAVPEAGYRERWTKAPTNASETSARFGLMLSESAPVSAPAASSAMPTATTKTANGNPLGRAGSSDGILLRSAYVGKSLLSIVLSC